MYKIRHFVPLILALFFIGVYQFGIWCDYITGICDGTFLDKNLYSIKLIYIYALTVLPVTVILPFFKNQALKTWIKFAIPWLVISFFIVAKLSVSGSDLSGFNLYQPSPEDATRFMGALFSIISFALFGVYFLRAKLKK